MNRIQRWERFLWLTLTSMLATDSVLVFTWFIYTNQDEAFYGSPNSRPLEALMMFLVQLLFFAFTNARETEKTSARHVSFKNVIGVIWLLLATVLQVVGLGVNQISLVITGLVLQMVSFAFAGGPWSQEGGEGA